MSHKRRVGKGYRAGGKGHAKFGRSMGPSKQVIKGRQKKRMSNSKIISAMKR